MLSNSSGANLLSSRRLVCALVAALALAPLPATAQEFVGPFPSWADVKRDYGAVGDGKADDTAAINRALDDLRQHKKHCVLFFPAGTYRLTDTVKTLRKAHTDCMVTVVGEDPATTILRWDGQQGGTIFKYDAWYAKISRLTLDGAGKAKVALAYGNAFSTFNETSDMVFKDVATGMLMGTSGNGQAENAVLRCKFLRCSASGLLTVNFNSMDIWVWDSLFEDCGIGLLNQAGNFHAYHNLFLRSKTMDIGINNLMIFTLVNNTSIGSKCFMDWSSLHSWGSPTSITGNRIIDPTGDFAIRLGNGGPYLVMDNIIKNRPESAKPAVHMTWGDQTFIGNTYTVMNPVVIHGRQRSLDEKVVDPKVIDTRAPVMPGAPTNHRRKIFEVKAGAGAEAIQKAVDEAARLVGQRPVVHLPMGVSKIDRTITVPAGCDVQILGDGASEVATVLHWTGKGNLPLLRLLGPVRATIGDLNISAGNGVGIEALNCDQPGSRIFADQLNATGQSAESKPLAGVLVDGVENGDVLLRNFQGGTTMKYWIVVSGGANRRVGKSAPGQVSVLCGATGTSDHPYNVEKGGKLVVRSVYHEVSGRSPQALILADSGVLAIDSTRFSYATAPGKPLVELQGFRGDFAMTTCMLLPVDSPHPATIRIWGDGADCNALWMNSLFWAPEKAATTAELFKNEAKPPARAALLLCNMNGNLKNAKDDAKAKDGFVQLKDQGTADDDGLIRKTLAPLRAARIWNPADTKASVTDFRLQRVFVSAGKDGVGVRLNGNP